MIPYQRELVTAAMNEELRKEFWKASEERERFALSNWEELKNADDATRARFIELWRAACARFEKRIAAEGDQWPRDERGICWKLMIGASNCIHEALQSLRAEQILARARKDQEQAQAREELKLAQARKDGYEDGRKDGIVEVFNRDKKNREKGQGFAETPQGMKKRAKAELCDAACEAYHDAMQTENPISWEKAVTCAAKKLDRRITNLRSKAEMARLWYPDWREKHVRKRDSNPKP